MVDALRLFRRLHNKKAVSIASNNLGNTLLSIYREIKILEVDKLYHLTISDVISQGIAHFNTAISLGEEAYDEYYEKQGWSPSCLNFMQHLANRYFNRGMFLLIIKDDHNDPSEIERLGMRDLKIADDMDQEVVAYGEDIGWGSAERIASRFNVNITRIKGYNLLHHIGYEHDWGVEELIQDTIGIIRTEYKKRKSDLFSEMSLAGRLQELEMQLIRYKLMHNDFETAAKIAVRMLIEDEHVFVEAIRQTLNALVKYIETDKVEADFRGKMMPVLKQYLEDVGKIAIQKREEFKNSDLDSVSMSMSMSMSGTTRDTATSSSIIPMRASLAGPGSYNNGSSARSNQSCHEESGVFVTMEDF